MFGCEIQLQWWLRIEMMKVSGVVAGLVGGVRWETGVICWLKLAWLSGERRCDGKWRLMKETSHSKIAGDQKKL